MAHLNNSHSHINCLFSCHKDSMSHDDAPFFYKNWPLSYCQSTVLYSSSTVTHNHIIMLCRNITIFHWNITITHCPTSHCNGLASHQNVPIFNFNGLLTQSLRYNLLFPFVMAHCTIILLHPYITMPHWSIKCLLFCNNASPSNYNDFIIAMFHLLIYYHNGLLSYQNDSLSHDNVLLQFHYDILWPELLSHHD